MYKRTIELYFMHSKMQIFKVKRDQSRTILYLLVESRVLNRATRLFRRDRQFFQPRQARLPKQWQINHSYVTDYTARIGVVYTLTFVNIYVFR